MVQEVWLNVESYVTGRLVPADDALSSAVETALAAGLPAIEVSPPHGKLLHLLARLRKASQILEIGTLGGYSTIWMARALAPGGRIVTLEKEPRHAEVARANFEKARVSALVDLRLGIALETLPKLAAEGAAFDMVFIDADKENNASYLDWALRMSRAETLIVVDNVIRDGAVADPNTTDPRAQGVRRLYDALKDHPRIDATAIQTVGSKGYDGLILGIVKEA